MKYCQHIDSTDKHAIKGQITRNVKFLRHDTTIRDEVVLRTYEIEGQFCNNIEICNHHLTRESYDYVLSHRGTFGKHNITLSYKDLMQTRGKASCIGHSNASARDHRTT